VLNGAVEAAELRFAKVIDPSLPTMLKGLLTLPALSLKPDYECFCLTERVDMQTGAFTPLLVLGLFSVVAAVVSKIRSRNASSRREVLRRRLQQITTHNQAKSERLIEFERTQLVRNRRPKENLDHLMARAIRRWERDNAFAVSIY